jgi:hypothetical protein
MKNKSYKSKNADGRVVFLQVFGCQVREFRTLESKHSMYDCHFTTVSDRDDFAKTHCGINGSVVEIDHEFPLPLTGYMFARETENEVA